ncbi:MAG: glutathione S-transferase N-terminal domain-containing protein [Pseudorhodoplanes sp.]
MELAYSTTSPFVRKVLIVAQELGIADRIKNVPTHPHTDKDRLTPINPLSMVPAFKTDAGEALFDSPVICDYLDVTFGKNRFIPASGDRRWQVLKIQALADGVLDASLLVRYELGRPAAQQSAEWKDRQMGRMRDGIDALEKVVDSFGSEIDLRHVAVACMIGYVLLRFPDDKMFDKAPKLTAFYKTIMQRPSFATTAPK